MALSTLDPTLSWSVIHPRLQASTILAQRLAGSSASCTLCANCDHVASQCALAQLQQPTVSTEQPTMSRSSQHLTVGLLLVVQLGRYAIHGMTGSAYIRVPAHTATCVPVASRYPTGSGTVTSSPCRPHRAPPPSKITPSTARSNPHDDQAISQEVQLT